MNHSLLRFLAGFSIILILAFSSNPPNGRTGAPGEGLCSGCHDGSSSQFGDVMISGVPATITPGQTYTLTVMSNTTSNSSLAGFQMVGLHDTGNINAGSMTNPTGGSTITVVGSGRSYHEHQPAAGFGGGTSVSWTVDWTAPTSGPNGDITFYAASVLANGNNQDSGDRVVTTNESGAYMAQPPLIAEITNSTLTSCNGTSDGTATVTASGGNPAYTYLWSNGETTSTAMSLSAGIQSVTVTDAIAQTASTTVDIMQPDLIAPNLTIDNNVSCNGLTDGSASAAPSGGTAPYTFLWSTGATTNTVNNLPVGVFSVTITDDNNCNESESAAITQPDPLVLVLLAQENVSCNGFNDGSATVSASGGTPNYTYTWTAGQIGAMASNLTPGVHVVTVTDGNNCTEELTVVITEPAELVISLISQTNATCLNGGSATAMANGGTMSYSYVWSDGQIGPTATNLDPNSYTCVVTDANGCEDILAVNILEPDPITQLEVNIEQITAPGADDGRISVVPLNGTPPYTYLWSTGSTDSLIENLPPNIYTVEVSDANGCQINQAYTIVEPGGCALTVDIVVVENLLCTNDSNAILTIESNGVINDILWSRGAITDTISNLPSGMYSVTVTDTANCEAMASITLTGMDTELPGYELDTLPLFLGPNGMATLDSATFYANLIDNCDENPTAIFSELNVNCSDQGLISMAFTLQDASGNIGPVTLYLNIIDSIAPVISCPDDVTVNTCDVFNYASPLATDNCDSVTIELVSGIGSGNVFPVGTTTETYRAVDQSGNTSMCSFNITVNSDLDVNIATTETTCFDSDDGTALISGTGGTAPYTFSVEPVSDVTMLTQGTYYLSLMDSTNCVVLDTFTIEGPDAIDLDSILVTNASAGGFDGSIEIDVIGGNAPYDFFWLRDTTAYSTQEDLFNLFSGYYSLIITDSDSCSARFDSIFVDEMVANQNLENISDQFKIFSYQRQIVVQPTTYNGVFDVYLYNGIGQIQSSQNSKTGEQLFDMSTNSPGIYIINVNIEGKHPITTTLIVY